MSSPPPLRIPPSSNTVSVRIINTTTRIVLPTGLFVQPHIPDHDHIIAPSYSFLIEHPSGRKLLFDNGVRKDWHNYSPKIRKLIEESGWSINVSKDVGEILTEGGIALNDIEAIVWSHYHWDHIGRPSLFPRSTCLVVGPGFKAHTLPGYPTGVDSPIQDSDLAGRHIAEISFTTSTSIGGLRAHDYFADGSFYLLDGGGHAVGHMCGLARVTSGGGDDDTTKQQQQETGEEAEEEEDTFIFMAGDAAHHVGEFRPTAYNPLPPIFSSQPNNIFQSIHRDPAHYTTMPFYELMVRKDGSGVAHDPALAIQTLKHVELFDSRKNVLVVLAHDGSLSDVLDTFPNKADGWRGKGWKDKGMWEFLRDFCG